MPSAPSRSEVEHLHRLMMQASTEASQLDRRLQEEQKTDGLAAELRTWHEAADAIHGAVERVRTELLRDGTPKDQVDRVRDRLLELKERSKRFDVQNDLDGCVQHWKSLGLEFAQLSGKHRDALVRLLESRKSRVDQTTSVLSSAQRTGGMAPEKHAKVRTLQSQRDTAREKYERLRQQYLTAERDCQAAERQKAQQAQAKEFQEKKAPLPNLAALTAAAKKGPVLVRLPDPKAAEKTAQHKLATTAPKTAATQAKPPPAAPKTTAAPPKAPPPPKPKLPAQRTTTAKTPDQRKIEAKKAVDRKDAKPGQAAGKKDDKKPGDRKDAKPGDKKGPEKIAGPLKPGMPGYGKPPAPPKPGALVKPQAPQLRPGNRPPALIKPGFRPPTLTQAQHAQPGLHGHHASMGAVKATGPARVSLERIERAAGWPTGMDGIGRGGQSAGIYFRADNLPEALTIQGTTTLQLGCAVRLDVMPSVQLFSATAGAPLKGKVTLGIISSGGRLGTIAPRSALEAAKTAAKAGGRQVAGRLGVIGKQLESAICDVLEDAADKIFRRAEAKAVQNKLPPRPAGGVKGPSTEHHVARFNHELGSILSEARAARGTPAATARLVSQLDRDHHARASVAGRLEATLSHLATATHRTLTDRVAGELRSNLARMDSILARLRGKAGQELHDGAREIGDILQRMGGIAAGKGGAPHIHEFRKLIDERRGQLQKIGADARRKQGAEALKHKGPLQQMPSAQVLGEKQLAALRRQHPGIDKFLKNASHAQLAAELGKLEKAGGLGSLAAKGKLAGKKGGLGSGTLAGGFHALGGAHLGGFGGGHRAGGLGSLAGAGGGLNKVLEKQLEHQVKRTKPQDVGKLLATFNKAPKGTPLNDLAKRAEAKQKALATKHSGRKGPAPSQITAAALLDVFKEHPKGKAFAAHLAPGGALRTLCEAAQRGHGLPVGQTAQHYLASRGHSHMFNAVATFNGLIKEGHKPHKWGLGSIGHFVSGAINSVAKTVSSATNSISNFASNTFNTAKAGISSLATSAVNVGRGVVSNVSAVVQRGVGMAKNVAGRVVSTARNVAGKVVAGARNVYDTASGFAHKAYDTASGFAHKAYDTASGFAHKAYDTASGFAHKAFDYGSKALHDAGSFISSKAHGLWNAAKKAGHSAWGGLKKVGHSIWGGIKHSAHGLSNLAQSGFQALKKGASWVGQKAGAAVDWAKDKAGGAMDWVKAKASGAAHWMGEKVHSGLEWAKKVGVAGGGILKKGFSMLKTAASYTPLGLAIRAGQAAGKWIKGGGLGRVWDKTKNIAGKAWAGIKAGYNATSKFLQSPAGQLLVTGLSLAASFIPGGMVVKAIVGGGIGAIQAISEGKDWKGILGGAAGGALTGALPFLKIGPLAKVGVGALQGGITALASGGNLKDVLKGAAGGAIDSFDPGAMKALSKLKGLTTAEKLLKGKNLSKAEKAFMEGSKFAGPLKGLEKIMSNPKARKMVGGLEKAGSKAIKGGIWVSGKAAKVQGVLDKVVGAGDKVHGVLEQVHNMAPGLSEMLGDNAAGHFVGKLGDWAGKGDEKLAKALEYGHGASDQLTKYRGYLDKGLGYAGVKNPSKAYEKMMARKDLAQGKKGGLAHVGKLKLEDHKKKHPELHLADATGKRTRGRHDAAVKIPRRRAGGTPADYSPSGRKGRRAGGTEADWSPSSRKGKKVSPHDAHEKHAKGEHGGEAHLPKKPRGGNKPKTALEKALAKGKGLIDKGQKVAGKVHSGLGKVQGVVEKGLAGAQKVQGGLEKASQLAKAGAGILGEDSELGKYLLEVSGKADQVHGYLEQGIGYAEEFNKGVAKAHDISGKLAGGHDKEEGDEEGKGGRKKPRRKAKPGDESPLEQATQLGGGKGKGGKGRRAGGTEADWSPSSKKKPSPHDKPPPGGKTPGLPTPPAAGETEDQKSKRLQHAWDKIGYVSGAVQRFETDYAKTQRKIQDLLGKGQGNAASIELMGLGSQCDEINKAIREAKTLAKGHDGYTKEISFYEDWHKKTKAKLHAAIADTKGLGGQVAISGFGISEATHPDIFENTKAIYAVRTKVEAFGEALHDSDAAAHVKKLLAEAKQAKADLGKLKAKYKKDKKAYDFLTGGGTQDKLIDECLKKLEGQAKGEADKGKKKPDATKKDPTKADGKPKKSEDVLKSVEGGLKAIDKYRKKAVKAGKKVDASLGKVEHALGKGIKIGKKVDSGLQKVAGVADQLSKALGEDTELGHFAHQVGEGAGKGHEKLNDALNLAKKGKKGLHKGRELFEKGLEIAKGHHEQKIEKTHGKKKANAEHEHGGGSPGELVKHAGEASKHGKKGPHGHLPKELEHLAKDGKAVVDDAGHIWKDGKKFVHDGKKLVHDTRHAAKDAEHMWKDGKKMWKDGKKSVHDVQRGVKDVKKGFGHAKSLWGHLKEGDISGALKDGKALIKDGKVLLKDGKTIVGDAKKLFGEGKHLFEEGKHLLGEGKHLWGEAKGLWGQGKHILKEGKHLLQDGKHVIGDVKDLVSKGKEWVHANLHKLDLGGVIEQGKKALHALPDWLKGLFGGGKKSPHDGPGPGKKKHHRHHHKKHHGHGPGPAPEPGPAPAPPQKDPGAGFSEAEIAQVVQGAMGWVTSFGKVVSSAIKEIEKLMSAGDTKAAGDRVQGVSVTSEQARFEVTRAVSTSSRYPALHKQAKEASKHYLEIRKGFFNFVKGLHGLGGKTQDLPGVDGKKYPDLLAISTDIDSLKVKVDALGEMKHADTPMQGPVKDLKKEASALRGRLSKAKSEHKADPAAAEVVQGLSDKLSQIERALGSHGEGKNVKQGDKDLGLDPQKEPRKRPPHRRRKRKKHDDGGGGDVIHVNPHGGQRDDMDVHDGQDVDPAASDTWIGSGEGVKLFSEVFGAFLPAEGAVVQHHAGGGGEVKPSGGGGIGFDIGGKAHGSVNLGPLHAQGGIGGALHGHLGAGGLDLSGKAGAGGSLDVGGLHLAGGVHAQGAAHIGPDGIHLEGGIDLGVDIAGHHFGGKIGGKFDISMKSIKSKLGKLIPKRATGFFKGMFDHLHGFADKIAGWSKLGGSLLGKGMHYAEMGMHGLSAIEKAAAKVQGIAGKAEGFLSKMGLGKLAGFAGKIGGAAGWVGKESKMLRGGLKTADKWMGKGKKIAGQVGGVADKASGIFDKASHGKFGALVSLFKASKGGDGIDGKLVPEKARLGSMFDEPRRLDISTLSRMETFLGGSFAGVRIHTGPGAAQVTNRFAAEAVTVKDHIFFAPGRFNPSTAEGQRLLAHELTHVMQRGRSNLDVRTAESEALHSEHTFNYANPQMETLNLSQPSPDFRLADGEGLGSASGVFTAKRNRSKGHETGGKDDMPDGEEFLEQVSNRVYEILMEELEQSFESR